MEKRKAICYAKLNCKNASRDVTDEQMELYFKKFCSRTNVEPKQFVIDRHEDGTYKSDKSGWNHILEVCEEESVDLILVPTYMMISPSFIDTLGTIREIKEKHEVSFYFIRERMCTADPDFETAFQLLMMVSDQMEYYKNNALEMRVEFQEATGHRADESSAVKVQIDDLLYEKSCVMSKDFGMSVEEFIEVLLEFATDPNKRNEFEKFFGFEEWNDYEDGIYPL